MRKEIQYVVGDATDPQGDGPKAIVHIVNDIGAWGRGIVVQIGKKWLRVKDLYKANYLSYTLGEVQFVVLGTDPVITVCNLFGQHDIRPSMEGLQPIRYSAVQQGLGQICRRLIGTDTTVHMPRIGCGLAGATWPKIEPIVRLELADKGISVTVYDLPKR